jgi:hypothetical protein
MHAEHHGEAVPRMRRMVVSVTHPGARVSRCAEVCQLHDDNCGRTGIYVDTVMFHLKGTVIVTSRARRLQRSHGLSTSPASAPRRLGGIAHPQPMAPPGCLAQLRRRRLAPFLKPRNGL